MRCRRREEAAHLLVVELGGRNDVIDRLLRTFRVTDAVMVRRRFRRAQVLALLTDPQVDRARVEERVREALADAPALLRWATYPEDGLTLSTLVERASRGVPNLANVIEKRRVSVDVPATEKGRVSVDVPAYDVPAISGQEI